MPDLPSLLRQRLQSGENARLQHPDADTLTAYVEQLLPAQERKLVLEHIAVCGDCREIVFLALPEDVAVAGPEPLVPEAMAPAATVPARRRWFLSPGFGLAASLAAMAVAITLVIEIPHRNKPLAPTAAPVRVEDKFSKVETPQAPPASPTAPSVAGNNAVASPAEPAGQSEVMTANGLRPGLDVRVPERSRTLASNEVRGANKKSKAEGADRTSRQQLRPEIAAQVAAARGDQIDVPAQVTAGATPVITSASPVIEARASRQDYLNAQRFGRDSLEAANAANLPSAPSLSTNGLASSKQSTLLSGNLQQPSNAYLAIPDAQQTSQGVLTFTPTPPEHHTMLSKIVDVGKRPIKRVEPALQAQNVGRFAMTFTNGQAIQHSDVIPANNAAEATGASSLSVSPAFTARGFGAARKSFLIGASPYRWKVNQGKLLKSADSSIWLEAYSASEGIEFSVVSAAGSEIWAGGNHGQLVHSKDGGSTWEKTSLGDATVGNVVSIENTGLNLHVITAPSQGWSSLDGGKTWIKLPQ